MKIYEDLRHVPLVRLCIPFIAGVFLGYYNAELISRYFLPFLILLAGLILKLLFDYHRKYVFLINDFVVHLILIVAGALYLNVYVAVPDVPSLELSWQGIVAEPPTSSEKYMHMVCLVGEEEANGILNGKEVKVKITTPLNQTITDAAIGDSIRFLARFEPVKNPGNPYEFDFARYLNIRRINYQAFVSDSNVTFGNSSGKLYFRVLADKIRKSVIQRFSNAGLNGDELAVASALTVGYRKLISDELENAYVNAGAIHVLAVSGLHVGIMYMVFSFLLGFLDRTKLTRLLKLILLVLIIWFYALVTGFSPSVIRAAVMFTFFAIGKNLTRDVNAYNILAGAAFCTLLFNPMLVFHIGFQLSYSAVAGILFFQPRFFNLISIKDVVFDRAYQFFTVSLAAQLGTLPFTIYYFHQFPVYFWITNVVLIPLIFLVICACFLFLLVSSFHLIAIPFQFIMKVLINGLNT